MAQGTSARSFLLAVQRIGRNVQSGCLRDHCRPQLPGCRGDEWRPGPTEAAQRQHQPVSAGDFGSVGVAYAGIDQDADPSPVQSGHVRRPSTPISSPPTIRSRSTTCRSMPPSFATLRTGKQRASGWPDHSVRQAKFGRRQWTSDGSGTGPGATVGATDRRMGLSGLCLRRRSLTTNSARGNTSRPWACLRPESTATPAQTTLRLESQGALSLRRRRPVSVQHDLRQLRHCGHQSHGARARPSGEPRRGQHQLFGAAARAGYACL